MKAGGDERGENQDRREFLKSLARNTTAAGLAALAAVLVARRQVSPRREVCINNSICRGCVVLSSCVLPQALSTRQATENG